jgi:hypothetical protein
MTERMVSAPLILNATKLYSILLPNIIRQIKSRTLRWAGHVACMGEDNNVYKVLMEKGKRKETT